MKILFVAMSESIHTVRWIRQLRDQGWELYLFPACDNRDIHAELDEIHICIPYYPVLKRLDRIPLGRFLKLVYSKIVSIRARRTPGYYPERLKRYIRTIRPDIIHSLETQSAGYLMSAVREGIGTDKSFPVWVHTTWGSDIYLFRQLAAHKQRLWKVMELADQVSVDCRRDRLILEEAGFSDKILPVEHATSGFNIEYIRQLRENTLQKTSDRKQILLKGYQGWSGRSLVAIRALTRCKDLLAGYTLAVYSGSGSEDIQIALELFSNQTGVPVKRIAEKASHATILENQGISRISIGLGISDGVPNSVMEAMAMGAFPVQSYTSAADEWVENEVTGCLVPPEDPEFIENALRKALLDDAMVDAAATRNWETICMRADFAKLSKEAIASYYYIYEKFIKSRTN
jgi:hypothetical protein